MRGLLVLMGSMVSAAAGYRFPNPMRVAGKSPPSWVPSELEWLWWLEKFHYASSTFRGDVQRRCRAIWLEATGHVPWGQRASFEGLVSSPDAEAAIKRELWQELQAGAQRLRLEDAVHAQRWATFEELRKAGKDRAAAEVWKEICGFNQRSIALDLHFAQVMGDWETASNMISSRKDSEAGLPPGTTARLERCLEG